MWIKEGFENKIGSSYSLNIEENEKENSIDDKVKSPELDWSDLEEKN